jgi:hypothetical protein
MWKNTVAIHSILKQKNKKEKFFNKLNIKKIKLTKIILEKNKQKNKKVQKKKWHKKWKREKN